MNVNKQTIFAVILAILFIGGIAFLGGIFREDGKEQESSSLNNTSLAAQFDHLSGQTTNSCGGGKQAVYSLPENGRLQGSCCSPMDAHAYQEQIERLKEYRKYDIIPTDPYDVPVEWARKMIEYSEKTELTEEQQVIYDKAVETSNEGGPCCCVCWHWYAYEGLAKHLIINESFSADQVAEIWDISDACGGDHKHNH